MLEGNDVKAGAEWVTEGGSGSGVEVATAAVASRPGKEGAAASGLGGGWGGASEQIAALPVAQGSEGELGLAAGRAQQVRGGRGLGFLF